MAARPELKDDKTTIVTRVVKSGVTVAEGVGVKKGTNDGEVDLCGAGDNLYGVALDTVVGDGVKTVQIAIDGGVIPVKCSGTATAGAYAECGVAGFQNRVIGGGTTVRYLAGQFTQDGAAGEVVGLALRPFAGVSS